MRILVTGGAGQLATAMARADPAGVIRVGRPEFDFGRADSLGAVLRAHRPDLVVNAAAWTAVDAAEAAPLDAARANAEGPGTLAALCHAAGIGLIHVSTDYVFDGAKGAPYVEGDAPSPTGVYGASKLAGERAVMAAHGGAIILRTAWVYAEGGRNFVRTMLAASRTRRELRVVADQRGNPTNADDLAQAILAVARRPGTAAGIYHAAGTGETTWHGFAQAIFAEAGRHGWPVPDIAAIATADYPTPALRPADSRLDCSKLARTFGVELPPWQPSLARAVARMCRAEQPAMAPG